MGDAFSRVNCVENRCKSSKSSKYITIVVSRQMLLYI